MTTTRDEATAEEHPSRDDRFALVDDEQLNWLRHEQDQRIETFHVAQNVFGFLSEEVLLNVAGALMLPTEHGVWLSPPFTKTVHLRRPRAFAPAPVCTKTSCYVKGADRRHRPDPQRCRPEPRRRTKTHNAQDCWLPRFQRGLAKVVVRNAAVTAVSMQAEVFTIKTGLKCPPPIDLRGSRRKREHEARSRLTMAPQGVRLNGRSVGQVPSRR